MRQLFFAPRILAACLALSVPAAAVAAANTYTLNGAIQGSYAEANCSLRFSKYGKVWTLRLKPDGAYSPAVNLFFSPKFGPARTGEFPIKFSYRNATETFGGSVTTDDGMFSNDSQGRVTISRFDDRVAGSFSLATANRDADKVEAEGQFDCPRGDALK